MGAPGIELDLSRSLIPPGPGKATVRFSYELRYPGGGDAGTFETNLSDWAVGDTFRADGNRLFRITAIIPAELVAEFIEGPVRGVWEVGPYVDTVDAEAKPL
jgi:hypothetical protein